MRPKTRETVELGEDCEAYLIPEGIPLKLRAGTKGIVTQALGGDVSLYVDGNLVQIFAGDAHVLGEKYRYEFPAENPDTPLEEQVWNRLRTCHDPEIPVNIVELGLVYDCRLLPGDDGHRDVVIRMTLTAPACGMGPILAESVRHRLLDLEGIGEVRVEMVFDPPWDQSMMSEAAKLELGML